MHLLLYLPKYTIVHLKYHDTGTILRGGIFAKFQVLTLHHKSILHVLIKHPITINPDSNPQRLCTFIHTEYA